MMLFRFLCLFGLAALVTADVYMHNPRGSNNRLDERSANRANGNRLFDSQNNNRGGYNKGDKTDEAFGNDYGKQYHMLYYMSDSNGAGKSYMTVEWTNQHGCGGNENSDPHKLNCNLVLQYMCVPREFARDRTRDDCRFECYRPREGNPTCEFDGTKPKCRVEESITSRKQCGDAGFLWMPATFNNEFNCPHSCSSSDDIHDKDACEADGGDWETHTNNDEDGNGNHLGYTRIRDGVDTDRQEYTKPNNNNLNEQNRLNRKKQVERRLALHESWDWYDECYRRERNKGLFTADQNLRTNSLGYSSAVFTRQNPNDNRRGYECPEERDYYPYWHPTPWVDIAILTDRTDLCPTYQAESENVKEKHICRNTETCGNCIRFNNEADCTANGGEWISVASHGQPPPVCQQAPWSRHNHLGNSRFGEASRFEWTLPYLHVGSPDAPVDAEFDCTLRLRYNISTDDYDPWRVNASFNNNPSEGVVSPVRQNPNVDIGTKRTALRLAINTAQFGRTFQDRSHKFVLAPRPATSQTTGRPSGLTTPPANLMQGRNLYNLNVRGKRGNIVQTFPSVEYDFVPNKLSISEEDLVHVQWTGSNTHNNGNPAGDGQAGDAGEGRGGTDRHNFVELHVERFAESFPATWEENTLFKNMLEAFDADTETYHAMSMVSDRQLNSFDDVRLNWGLRMASAGFYRSFDNPSDSSSLVEKHDRNDRLDDQLDNAPASFRGGVFRFRRGIYNYMCTRNHNFTNRDQKGHLTVE